MPGRSPDEVVPGGVAAPRLRVRGYLMVSAAAASWGTFSLFFRSAERGRAVSPALEGVVVLAAMAVIFIPWALWSGWVSGPPREKRPTAAFAGLLVLGVADAFNCLCFYAAMQRTSIAIAVLSHYLAPILVTVAAPFALGESGRRSSWPPLLVALAGLVLLLEPWSSAAHDSLGGAVLGAASAVFYATNLLVTKRLTRWFTAHELLGYHAIPALLVLLPFIPRGGWAVGQEAFAFLMAGALLPGVGAGLLFVRGLSAVPAGRASILTLIEPVVAVGVGALAWREIPGPAAAVGAAMIVGGAYAVLKGD